MPSRYRGRILDHLQHDRYRPVDLGLLQKQLRISTEEREIFLQAIDGLAAEGAIEEGRDRKWRLPTFPDRVEGTIRITSRGFGFVRTDRPYREGDLFIPAFAVADALSGDRVAARVVRRERGRGRGAAGDDREGASGRVEEVLSRGRTRFSGELVKEGRQWLARPDGKVLREPVVIRDPGAKNAVEGDKIVFELLLHPEAGALGEGVIIEVLGEAGRPAVETAAVIASFGLPTAFPEPALEEAHRAGAEFERRIRAGTPLAEDREDLTELLTITIDPPDARDFDDAISVERSSGPDGSPRWTLGVHIADVAAFVPQGGSLDSEAQSRGNSVYLPRLVIPMLPESLSNGVCSLQEDVPRFTKSAFIVLDARGRVLEQRICRSLIRSRKRLTYLEAQAVIDGDLAAARRHARTETAWTPEVVDLLRRADELARILQRRRMQAGQLVLQLPEFELVFDDAGQVVDAEPEDTSFTHTLIEMFMVEANEAVARIFADLGVAVLRRIHPDPGFGDVEQLRTYARVAGFNLPEEPDRRDLQALLERTRDTPVARAVHLAVLKTLAKAIYGPTMIGHYALASEHYLHFTSPIRRYPDLAVHRACEAYLDLTENGRRLPGGRKLLALRRDLAEDERCIGEQTLVELGRHCSDTEVNAEEAERSLRTFLVLRFLEDRHLGEDLPGAVTGVMASGAVFVSLDRFLVEGRVPPELLPGRQKRGGAWSYHPATMRLIAPRSGASIGLGDPVVVRIHRIDAASREMDLEIVEVRARLPEAVPVPEDHPGRPGHVPRGLAPGRTHGKHPRDRSTRRGGGAKGRGKGSAKTRKRR
jgi:ribonuclease R